MARKGQKPIFIYLTDDERAFVEKRVEQRVTTISEYIRRLIRDDAKRQKENKNASGND